MSSVVSELYDQGLMEARSVEQTEVFAAAEQFNDGTMADFIPTDEDLQKGFDGIPKFPGNEFQLSFCENATNFIKKTIDNRQTAC